MDPSEVGRYENTPVILPILEQLDVIDEPVAHIPGLSEIRAEDLIPEVSEYIIGPGDGLSISILDLYAVGAEASFSRRVDELGYIRSLPFIGDIKAEDLTARQLEQRLIDILDPDIVRNPVVTVTAVNRQQQTYSVVGAGAGAFTILRPNFRLLDAIALSGGLPEGTETVYVIRQVPLVEEVEKGFRPEIAPPGDHRPPRGATPADQGGAGRAPEDPAALIERLSQDPDEQPQQNPQQPQQPDGGEDEADAPASRTPPEEPAPDAASQERVRYIWLESRQDFVPVTAAEHAEAEHDGPTPDQLVTQRIIEVDAEALVRGEAQYNIVVRPGDVIHFPQPQRGLVYLGGQGISRGGVYDLPALHRVTLKQMVMAAGGLSPLAIPERVDLIRRIGDNQEATVRMNLRAIFEGVQPDLFMKPSDTVNFGTSLFASHAAVIRNSFRFSYGFGFLLDRNFGNDVFGAPPRSDFVR